MLVCKNASHCGLVNYSMPLIYFNEKKIGPFCRWGDHRPEPPQSVIRRSSRTSQHEKPREAAELWEEPACEVFARFKSHLIQD